MCPDDGVEEEAVGFIRAGMSAGYRNKRQAAGNQNCQRDAYEPAKLDIPGIAVIHTEINAGGAGSGEETDNDGYYGQESDGRFCIAAG